MPPTLVFLGVLLKTAWLHRLQYTPSPEGFFNDEIPFGPIDDHWHIREPPEKFQISATMQWGLTKLGPVLPSTVCARRPENSKRLACPNGRGRRGYVYCFAEQPGSLKLPMRVCHGAVFTPMIPLIW